MPFRRHRKPFALLLSTLMLASVLGVPYVLEAADPAAPAAEAKQEGPRKALVEARRLFLSGKYAESSEAYEATKEKSPFESALGLARCFAAEGKQAEAGDLLRQALAKLPPKQFAAQAQLEAELARIAFDSGKYDDAEKHLKSALTADDKNRLARWIQAELHRTAGRLTETGVAYQQFIDDYNATETFTDPDDLRLIGLGAAQYARWNRLSDQFTFLVNELFPSAVELDKGYWPAHYEAGLLFLEKYNEAEASKEFKAALALNPKAAEIYAAQAKLALQNFDLATAKRAVERALAINPRLLAAHWAAADIHMANYEAAEAAQLLEGALKLNPRAEETLGRLAAAYAVVDGWSDAAQKSDRFKKIVAEVEALNPHAGEFYFALAQGLDALRRYPAAAEYFRTAVAKLPQLTTARGELGLMCMRLGEEVEAKRLLDESFAIDPFNVRVKNMRKVLEVLDEYTVIETKHFVIKFDRGHDEMLAKYASKYLEEQVYPELCKKYGFEPEGKSLFEIFNRSRNTGGHGWFSARMVGLPFVGTVGACAGKMVALASPNDMPEKFNWARVLKHEFVHVLNLQQSRFNIPHWYTEALAVESEGYPRSEVWNKLLAERVPQGDLFNLDTINIGFVRPKSSLDWQMAYCQAQLYAQYMLKTYGDDALAKMLAAYRDNLDTRAALKRSFDVDQAKFEAGYLDYIRNIAKGLSSSAPQDEMKFSELVKAHQNRPDDNEAASKLAAAYFAREEFAKARKLAETVLEKEPKNQRAAFVAARVRLVVGDEEEAEKLLADALDRAAPNPELLSLLASLAFKAGRHDEAENLYALGAEKFAYEAKWKKALAKTYLVTKNEAKLAPALEQLALADADDGTIRKKLAQLALARSDYAAARRWSEEALHCDVLDVVAHRLAAESLVGLKDDAAAIVEYDAAVTLEADNIELWAGMLAAAKRSGKADIVARAAKTLKQLDPEHAELKP
ncbi:MAG: tetratricopeptide repeat protein [Planctomycetia bacterium]|nr:tetratricopeptide repeat protein [Planctomycetia bacterium]